MRMHHSVLGGVAVALTIALTVTGCSNKDATADPPPTTPTTASSTPTQSTSPTAKPETDQEKAIRLATEQTKAYILTYERLYAEPDLPLSILDKYADTQALLEIKSSIQKRRDRGERLVGKSTITKAWLGPEGVVFNDKAPMAVVDLYICVDLNDSHFVDQHGNRIPDQGNSKVSQARYATYAQDWPNESPSDWRVGKEYAAGEPCPQ